jgi:hypothetical protein
MEHTLEFLTHGKPETQLVKMLNVYVFDHDEEGVSSFNIWCGDYCIAKGVVINLDNGHPIYEVESHFPDLRNSIEEKFKRRNETVIFIDQVLPFYFDY